MICKLRDFLEATLPASIFAILYVVISWIFVLKSKGMLKTEEEWYGFGASVMDVVPKLFAILIFWHIAAFTLCYTVMKIYCYFKGKNDV